MLRRFSSRDFLSRRLSWKFPLKHVDEREGDNLDVNSEKKRRHLNFEGFSDKNNLPTANILIPTVLPHTQETIELRMDEENPNGDDEKVDGSKDEIEGDSSSDSDGSSQQTRQLAMVHAC